MQFRKVLALRGPNVWASFPVLEAWVELEAPGDARPEAVAGLGDRLREWLPLAAGLGQVGGIGEVLAAVALDLQRQAGVALDFARSMATGEPGVLRVAVAYDEELLGKACLDAARDLVAAAAEGRAVDVEAEVSRLRSIAHQNCFGPSTRAIVEAARRRGIPHRRLNSDSLVQLGHGCRARRIVAAETDRTGAIAESIAQDKELTRDLLLAVGVPVPQGRPAESAEDAWAAAEEIGVPVVVKPRYGNHGRGVATNLSTREQVMAAYALAREQSDDVIVETYAEGADHRVLVIDGKMVAAARREPAHVVGDGAATIADLIARVNRDPRRGDDHATSLTKIRLDPIAMTVLAEQGYAPDSIPPENAVVLIRRNANLSTGGTAIDVTDTVHPEVAARCVEAARMVGLDIAGIDVICRDIRRPLEEQGGIICEVNAGPGLRMHLEPSAGTPRPVGDAIVSSLFPEGDDGRIPIAAITGVNGKTTTTRLLAHLVRTSGKSVGMTCTDGIVINGRTIEAGDCSGPASARAVLLNPAVEVAVLETARGGILRAGLGFDRCDVAIVTNIGEGDHLGISDVETPERLADVKRTIVQSVKPTGVAVLNAADPLVVPMAGHCLGSTCFFALEDDHPVLADHLARGGLGAYARDGMLVLAEGDREVLQVPLDEIPLTHGGRVGFQIENALAASAAAWRLGVPAEAIRAGLESFQNDCRHTPGRFNVLQGAGATVILDYGHNPSALLALIDAFGQFPHERRLAVFTAVGDRRDADIHRLGEILGQSFDAVVLFEDLFRRGRPDGQIVEILRRGMAEGPRVTEIHETRGEVPAIDAALRWLQPGDLLLIQPDSVEAAHAYVKRRLETLPPRPALVGAV